MRMLSKFAFTLAEVLITLGIIGVVAAITIPVLINNANNAATVTSVKEVNSILTNAIKLYMADNNCAGDLRLCGAFSSDKIYLWDSLKPYFKIQKDCGTSGGCFPNVIQKMVDGTSTYGVLHDWATGQAILNNGMSIMVYGYNPAFNCNRTMTSKSGTGIMKNACGYFIVDINGSKAPNIIGRDTFFWYITAEGVLPEGNYDDGAYSNADGTPACDPNGNATQKRGEGCTAKILQENAVNY